MSIKQLTTWEGFIERNMDASTLEKMYCLAKSKTNAREELERLCKKKYPNTSYISITHIEISTAPNQS